MTLLLCRVRVRVRVTWQLMVSQSVSQSLLALNPSGICDQIFGRMGLFCNRLQPLSVLAMRTHAHMHTHTYFFIL